MKEKIRQWFLSHGADLCGFAAADAFENAAEAGFRPRDVMKDCETVIVLGRRLPRAVLSCGARRVTYGYIGDMNTAVIDRLALDGAIMLEDLGALALPLPSDSPQEYWDSEKTLAKGIISMSLAAVLAGLGQQGKNTLVINERFGNMVNYGAVLTSLRLPADPPAKALCIPSCRKCLDACPTGALDGRHSDQSRCRAKAYGKTARGFATVECCVCREICPLRFGTKQG